MNILSFNIGIGSSVCLFKDGRVLIALQEERLSRQKGHMGFPGMALEFLKKHFRGTMSSLDVVGIAGHRSLFISKQEFLKRYKRRSTRKEDMGVYERYFKPLKDGISEFMPDNIKYFLNPKRVQTSADEIVLENLKEFNVTKEQIVHLNHHDCHAAAAYYGLAEEPDKKYLVFTLDGGGDGECASVSIGYKGQLKRVASTPSGNSIGNIYSSITHMLGFTPHEHEYKLMGLSSYVPSRHSIEVRDILSKYLYFDEGNPLTFRRLTPERTTWTSLRLENDLRLKRFDNIAAGLQVFTENLVIEWIIKGIREKKIHDILLSGGVFMNVKMNQKIANLPEVQTINVFPSCGDESNSIGCAFWAYSRNNGSGHIDFGPYTLGNDPTYDLNEAERKYGNSCEFKELVNPEEVAAELLAEGKIIARCSGPMEFGARALGNRSILADPIDMGVVEKVNFLIKQRDFWMPFAPAVLWEDAHEYLEIPPQLPPPISPYMMFNFNTTERRDDMVACLHRADKTARAQIVSRELYPEFHRLITYFKEITGRSAIMNTSFNIHGHPIVMGSMDAVEILVNSNLDYLLIENVLVSKKI